MPIVTAMGAPNELGQQLALVEDLGEEHRHRGEDQSLPAAAADLRGKEQKQRTQGVERLLRPSVWLFTPLRDEAT
jgi:hypothetical protein